MRTSEIVTPTLALCQELVQNLSEENLRELPALGVEPLPALLQSIGDSEQSRALVIEGHVAVITGVVRRTWGGQLWLLTSTVVRQFPITFMRRMTEVLEEMSKGYKVLSNIAHPMNKASIRMFEHFGAKVVEGGIFINGHEFKVVKWEAPCA